MLQQKLECNLKCNVDFSWVLQTELRLPLSLRADQVTARHIWGHKVIILSRNSITNKMYGCIDAGIEGIQWLRLVVCETKINISPCVSFNFLSPPYLVDQVHIHRDLHLWVPYKDPGQGLLCGEVHFPAGPVELAGFQCYTHGVSIMTSVVRISLTRSGID